jgi:uncharacterized protein
MSGDINEQDEQYLLGLMYIRGEGKPKDYENGIKYCLKAAKQGHVKAQYVLGVVYSNTFQNYKEAINWYSKAAAQGNAEAQYNLGWMNLFGQGVPSNSKNMFKLHHVAAKQGHARAQCNLGRIYEEGDCGIPQDTNEAINWYSKAAAQGNPEAQAKLDSLTL